MRTTVHSMPKRFCATCPTTMFVLSPFVATTTASASSMPASRRTLTSMPCPTTKPPGQWSPRRASASSFSSIATTSQPTFVSFFATEDPTLPQPTTIAFISVLRLHLLRQSEVFFQDALRIGDDHHLARGPAKNVVDGRAEEPGLAPPPGRRAHHDQICVVPDRLVDDRLPDRAGTNDVALDLDAVLRSKQLGLGERRLGLLLGFLERRVERLVEGNANHVDRLHRAAALLGELDRGAEHLFADQTELHRDENPLVDALELGHEIPDRRRHATEHLLARDHA